jgi:4-amino-4-deoxy-L-arabinose transferase-like glycosyltransferase
VNGVATRGRAVEWTGTAIVLLIALRYWLWYFHRNANLLDEGSTAAQALRVLNGELIYRDFFTVVTPASYYTVAGLFQLFGPGLMVLRWAALVTGLAILLVTLLIARRVMSWPFAAAAALMTTVWGWFLVTPNFYSLQAALFALLALWCYLRHVERPHTRWMVLAGVFAGLAVLTKQNVGAYAVAAIVGSTWWSRGFRGDPPPKGGG